ncbi:MAG: efflux RND transporter periplasmic adaptor subunit [Methylobacteriaceae bacterium]|nr:efflux RND transporter periplasmic adaptor subunit [Methylobacteriaceae bacterium]
MGSRVVFAVLVLGAAAGAAWLEFGRPPAPGGAQASAAAKDQGPAVPVMAGEVGRGDVEIDLSALGTVQAFNSVLLTSRVDGQIVRLNFGEGEDVHAGDVLVELDPQPFEAALAQAQSMKLKDQAQLNNARLDLERAQRLVTTGAGTTQQLDTARAQVAQLEASTKADQAAIDAAQVQLNYSRIRSPLDGRTGTRLVDAGNIVRGNSATGIVMINQIHPVSVSFALPADALSRVRARMKLGDVRIIAQDRNDKKLATGKLAVIDNQINVATATVVCKATFENTDEALWPGQFVNVRIELDVRRNAVTVPPTAVLRGSEGTYAFIIDASSVVEKRPVKVDFSNQRVAVIAEGLSPGEKVVTDGQYRIKAGTLVEVVQSAAPRAAD